MKDLREDFDVSDSDHDKYIEIESNNYTQTIGLNFIADHSGLRPGKVHVLMGTTGSGKSTLCRSIMYQLIKEHKIMIYSTEETKREYYNCFMNMGFDRETLKDKICMYHEDKVSKLIKKHDTSGFIDFLRMKMLEFGTSFLVFDNLTSSRYYRGNPDKVAEFTDKFYDMVKECDFSPITLIHAGKGKKDGQSGGLSSTDARGTDDFAIRSEYFYILQRIRLLNKESGVGKNMAIVKVDKSRNPNTSNAGEFYNVIFDERTSRYSAAIKLSNESLMQIYNNKIRI